MKGKDHLLLWLLAIASWLVIMPLRAYSGLWAMIAHSIVFAILTWWALKKYAPKVGLWRPLIPFLAPWILELTARCFIDNYLFSLPLTVMPLAAVIASALFCHYRKVWILLFYALLLFGVTMGFDQWKEWASFRKAPVLTVNLADCEVSDSTHSFKLSEVKSDYLVLDVWYSACGVCMKQMPDVQALHDAYKDNEKIEVVSLFACLLKGEIISDGYRIVHKKGCDFPVYAIEKDSPILTRCEIDSYPRVLILDKNRTVIFHGSLEFAKRKLKDL